MLARLADCGNQMRPRKTPPSPATRKPVLPTVTMRPLNYDRRIPHKEIYEVQEKRHRDCL